MDFEAGMRNERKNAKRKKKKKKKKDGEEEKRLVLLYRSHRNRGSTTRQSEKVKFNEHGAKRQCLDVRYSMAI